MTGETDLAAALAVLTAKLDSIEAMLTKAVDDHEVRIRRIEAWMYALPASVLLAVASCVASLVLAFKG